MNIIQIQNQLKGLPDNIIAGYVQNPNAQVPAYLALSELQRRKTTREEYQQNQQAPQQSVAQSLTSQIPPPQMQQPQAPQQQGVASLPMGNTPQPQQNFARGGIVAFANGGDVGFSSEDDVYARAAKADAYIAAEEARMVREAQESDARAVQAQKLFDEQLAAKKLADAQKAAAEEAAYKQRMAGYGAPLSKEQAVEDYNLSTLPSEQIDIAKKQIYEQLAAQRDAPSGIYTLDENLPQETIPETAKGLPTLTAPDYVPNIDERAGPRESDVARIRKQNAELDKGRTGNKDFDDIQKRINQGKLADSQERTRGYKAGTEKSNARIAAAKAAQVKGGRSADLPVIEIPPEVIPKTAAGIAALPTPQAKQVPPQVPQTALEKAQAAYMAALAPDQKTRANLTGRMEHLDEQAKWRREHTDMDAVTKAGLAMMQAGARPGASFLGAVGAGGEAGIKSLAEARDFQYATEEKRAALEQQLTQLERAENIAVKQFGYLSEEAKMVRGDKKEAAKALADASKEEKQAQREFDKAEHKLQRRSNELIADKYSTARAASGANSEAKKALDVVKASIGAVDKAIAANEKELLKLSSRDNTDPAKAEALTKRRTLEAEKRTHQNQLDRLYSDITGETAPQPTAPTAPSTKGKLQQMPDGTFKYGP